MLQEITLKKRVLLAVVLQFLKSCLTSEIINGSVECIPNVF